MTTSWRRDQGDTGVTGDRGKEREGGTGTGKVGDMAKRDPEMPPAGDAATWDKDKTSNLQNKPETAQ